MGTVCAGATLGGGASGGAGLALEAISDGVGVIPGGKVSAGSMGSGAWETWEAGAGVARVRSGPFGWEPEARGEACGEARGITAGATRGSGAGAARLPGWMKVSSVPASSRRIVLGVAQRRDGGLARCRIPTGVGLLRSLARVGFVCAAPVRIGRRPELQGWFVVPTHGRYLYPDLCSPAPSSANERGCVDAVTERGAARRDDWPAFSTRRSDRRRSRSRSPASRPATRPIGRSASITSRSPSPSIQRSGPSWARRASG